MELLELGKNPISESNPSGNDVRYESEYEDLEQEIAKLSSPSASGADWDKIVQLAQSILGEKSKNILVASYLCIALMNTEGLKGLAKGIHILREMLENFWETLYPPQKRMRGRANAVTWWSEKIDAAIPNHQKETWPKDEKESFVADLNAIDGFLSDNIEDGPILRRMNENLIDLIDVEPEKPPEPLPDETQPETAEQQGASPSSAPVKQAAQSVEISGDNADKILEQGLDILGKAAALYIKQGQISAVPFRANRIAVWLSIKNLPPTSDGKTMIPPPDEEVISLLNGMYQSRNWTDLLAAAESRVRQFVFWIDLSRYVAEALEQLGNAAAGSAVADETSGYVNRLAGIERMAFSDGTPFANEETKEWLRTISKKSGGGSSGGSAGQAEQLVEKETANALNAIKENKTGEALKSFMEKMRQAPSLRDRFIWEIGLCRLMIRAKQPRLVLPYFKEILEILDTYKVEQWEPLLALEGLSLILSGLRMQDEKNKDDELVDKILNRISVLDPGRALELI